MYTLYKYNFYVLVFFALGAYCYLYVTLIALYHYNLKYPFFIQFSFLIFSLFPSVFCIIHDIHARAVGLD